MTDCDRVFTAIAEGEALSAPLRGHAKQCPDCSRLLAAERALAAPAVPTVAQGAALREALDRDLAPVRARSPLARAWLPALVAAAGAVAVVGVTLSSRPSPPLVASLASTGLLTLGSALGFLLLFVRGETGLGPSVRLRWAYVAAAFVLLAGVAFAGPGSAGGREHHKGRQESPTQPMAGSAAEAFGRVGREVGPSNRGSGAGECAGLGMALAALVGMSLFAASRRTSPVSPRAAGAVAGVAAGLAGAAALQLHCPCDGLHVVVGHGLPVVAGAALGALAGRRVLSP